jgi:hypothetical protein
MFKVKVPKNFEKAFNQFTTKDSGIKSSIFRKSFIDYINKKNKNNSNVITNDNKEATFNAFKESPEYKQAWSELLPELQKSNNKNSVKSSVTLQKKLISLASEHLLKGTKEYADADTVLKTHLKDKRIQLWIDEFETNNSKWKAKIDGNNKKVIAHFKKIGEKYLTIKPSQALPENVAKMLYL